MANSKCSSLWSYIVAFQIMKNYMYIGNEVVITHDPITPLGTKYRLIYTVLNTEPNISLEMPVPNQGHYSFHSFPVVD